MIHKVKNKGEAGSETYRRLHNILLMRHPRCTLDLWRIKWERRSEEVEVTTGEIRHGEGSRKQRDGETDGGKQREIKQLK